MRRVLLITNPAYDPPTQYLEAYSDKIISQIQKDPDLEIIELKKENVNRKQLTKIIEDKKPDLVLFNGHGSPDCVLGFNNELLISCGDNTQILENIIVHSLSCDSGKLLGPQCIENGTTAYLGYKEEYKLVHLACSSSEEMAADTTARFFLEPAFEAVKALIQGDTARGAFNRAQALGLNYLGVLLTSSNQDYSTVLASRLYHNIIHQVCLGDSSAKFS